MKHILFLLLSFPISILADAGLPNQPYIYVRGTADAEKLPDAVTLRFDLVARAPEQPKANTDVQERAAKVFDLLGKQKVAKDDVIADQLRSEADFEQTDTYARNRGKLIGYVVTRHFTVKARDVGAFPKLVDNLIATANAEFTGIEGLYSKQEELGKQLWEDALANAREQAERTVKKAGMKIDSVFAISPVPILEITSTMFPKGESGVERVIVTGSNIPNQEDRVSSEYRLPPVTFNQIVHVIYLISPTK